MCFGAGASFTAAAVLTGVGVASVKKVRSRGERLFALIPLIFAAQQFLEGALWILFNKGYDGFLKVYLTYAFLFVAYVFWPVYAPLSIRALEPREAKKRVMSCFVLGGMVTAAYLLFFLVSTPVRATVIHCSIFYDPITPGPRASTVIYAAVIFAPFLSCSHRPVAVLGLINLVFCAVAYYFYSTAFVSVWCFFAAALSVMIYFFVKQKDA